MNTTWMLNFNNTVIVRNFAKALHLVLTGLEGESKLTSLTTDIRFKTDNIT